MQIFRTMMAAGAAVAAFGATVSLEAQKAGGTKITATEVRTTFRDVGDAVWGDGSSYQTDALENTSNTLTAMQAANFMLDVFTATRGTPVRCININLSGVVAQRPGATLPLGGCVDAEITSLSFFFDSTDSLRDMGANTQAVKRLALGWREGAYQYHLRFKGENVDLGDGTGPQELANVGFTCTAAAAGCTAWTAEPIRCDVAATGGAYSALTNCRVNTRAVLERTSTKGNSTPEMLAVIEMPFQASVVRR
jgi:hypothetical protein